ncbi:MAG: hypothetical protein CSA66_00605 [Proteobacteria bacterium]|nr:MAG: hypothetical protein CSA66_00605 [Pseudomonadota bacterium]
MIRALWSGLRTEVRLILRTPPVLVLLLALPLLYPTLISWLYQANDSVDRPVIVVDEDHSNASRALTLAIDATAGARLERHGATLDEALEALRDQRVEAVALIPSGFGGDLARGERTAVRIWSDSANMLSYGVGVGAIGDAVQAEGRRHGLAEWARSLPAERAGARAEPIRVDTRIVNAPARAYGDFIVPAVFVVILQQLVMLGMAFSAGARREQQIEAPKGIGGWLGFAVPHLGLQAVGVVGLTFVIGYFGWPLRSPAAWLALTAAFVVSVLPFGVLAATFTADRASAISTLLFLSVPSLFLTGYVWPRDQMPTLVAAVGDLMPSTPALRGLRLVAFEGRPAAELVPVFVELGQIALVGVALVALRLAWLRWRRSRVAASQAA